MNMAVYSLQRAAVSALFLGLFIVLFAGSPVAGSDPDIARDFGIKVTSGADLHYTAFRNLPAEHVGALNITFAFASEFPGVTGLGIAPAFLRFGPDSINHFHSHPRASEIFFIVDGELDAGLVDTANNLYTATLKKGDVFVFPKGLVHFQVNRSKTKSATVVAVFNSENAGRVSIPPALFNTQPRIETDIIMRVLQLDEKTVERLKAFPFPKSG